MENKPNCRCKYATLLEQNWARNIASCKVVECRSPLAKRDLKCFKDKNGVEYPAVRRPCDENFNLIPNADYLHVRSRFCNSVYCPFFEED